VAIGTGELERRAVSHLLEGSPEKIHADVWAYERATGCRVSWRQSGSALRPKVEFSERR
jgi:hypothetical protein